MTIPYDAAAALSLCVFFILSLLVHENSRLGKPVKRRFYITYLVIAGAMAAEWAGLALNGAPEWTRVLHAVVKCADYILTPAAGVCFVYQVSMRARTLRFMSGVLVGNALMQLVSIFTGWTFYLDEANVYHHGPLYPAYILVYCAALVAVVLEFIRYSRGYQRRNRGSLYAAIAFVCLAILLQEVFSLRVTYLVLTFSSALLFIHFSEFSQQKSDADLATQRKLLETDVLTGLFSRYAYTNDLHSYDKMPLLPEDLVIFSVDVNGLKNANDDLGHLAGDELIRGAADCISRTLGSYGRCYRTGGDEFIALLHADHTQAASLRLALAVEAERWSGQLVKKLSFSIGVCVGAAHPGLNIEKLVGLADQAMYADKRNYYLQAGHDRRGARSR